MASRHATAWENAATSSNCSAVGSRRGIAGKPQVSLPRHVPAPPALGSGEDALESRGVLLDGAPCKPGLHVASLPSLSEYYLSIFTYRLCLATVAIAAGRVLDRRNEFSHEAREMKKKHQTPILCILSCCRGRRSPLQQQHAANGACAALPRARWRRRKRGRTNNTRVIGHSLRFLFLVLVFFFHVAGCRFEYTWCSTFWHQPNMWEPGYLGH